MLFNVFLFLCQSEIYLVLLGLAKECTVIFVLKKGDPLWHKYGLLRTVALYKTIPKDDQSQEALILRKALCETTRYFTGYKMNKVFGSYDGPYLWAFGR